VASTRAAVGGAGREAGADEIATKATSQIMVQLNAPAALW
jgi:hypothetical protein